MTDRTVVVTGVTSGIGRALAARLVDEGARVVGLARDGDALRALPFSSRVIPVVADLADPAGRSAAIEHAVSIGPVDALVNNAAECVYALPTELPLDRWRRLFEVNLLAAVELVGALAPRMGPDGRVVNVSSVTGRFLAAPAFAPYGATKAALDYLSESLRLTGLAVTVVAPGLVDTPIYRKVEGFDTTEAKLRKAVPRWLDPEDVADAVVWALTRPPHVVVTDITLMPRGQPR